MRVQPRLKCLAVSNNTGGSDSEGARGKLLHVFREDDAWLNASGRVDCTHKCLWREVAERLLT